MKTIGWITALFFYQLVSFSFAAPPSEATGREAIWNFGHVDAGQCLYTSLQEKHLSSAVIAQIIEALKPYINFKRIPPQTAYNFKLDEQGGIVEFAIEDGCDQLHLTHRSQQLTIRRVTAPYTTISAVVRVSYEQSSGRFIPSAEAEILAGRIEEVLLETDLGLEFQPGDSFRIVIEKTYRGEVFFRYGHILAFELPGNRSGGLVVRYDNEYYDEQGRPLKKPFLSVPLHYDFVSCNFMKERRHPILGGVRPHRGVDFAAPSGTPVWAIADGQVATADWLAGYGMTVILRHAYGYETLYGHLSRFGPEIKPGVMVRQKQVVGYIGTTGLSTGPHLHFGLTCNGRHRDPFKENFPRVSQLADSARESFMVKMKRIKSLLADPPSPSFIPVYGSTRALKNSSAYKLLQGGKRE